MRSERRKSRDSLVAATATSYSPLPSLGARLTLPLHDDACGAVRERARAAHPLHRAGIDPKPLRDSGRTWCYRRSGRAHPTRGSDIS
jgi:hypothetical protein